MNLRLKRLCFGVFSVGPDLFSRDFLGHVTIECIYHDISPQSTSYCKNIVRTITGTVMAPVHVWAVPADLSVLLISGSP